MANGHNKRKRHSRRELFASKRKTKRIVPLCEGDGCISTAAAAAGKSGNAIVDVAGDFRLKITHEVPVISKLPEPPDVREDVDLNEVPVLSELPEPSDVREDVDLSNDDPLTVENKPVDQGGVRDTQIEGRRIVDLNFLLRQLQENFDNHNVALRCRFSDIKLCKSVDRGLRTLLHFMCETCQYEFKVWTDPDPQNSFGINESAVCGTITSGTGYSTLQEQLAVMSIPVMDAKTYRKYRNKLFDTFSEVTEADRKRAASLEREIAIKKGHVIDGVPYIEVIADGAWVKRSYAGGKHDALSGSAVIFGRETNLALFVGVRNKYCATHAKAELQNKEPAPHVCFKNGGRDASSTAMETSIILEGFRTSVEQNGLLYKTLISDGDSSVYQAIRDANPYAEYGVVVDKIECNNHLFRNLCRKIRLASNSRLKTPPSKEVMNVTSFWRHVFSSGLKIRQCVELARDFRAVEKIPESDKVKKLCEDILNIVGHVFGDHSNCHKLPFSCEPEVNGKNVLAELHRTGIYTDVYEAVRYLSCHAKSLLKKANNNTAEGCNSIVNKLNSGKRINHCMANSYEMRCYGAVMQHNTQSVLSMVQLHGNNVISAPVQKMERLRQRQNERTRLHRLNRKRKTRRSHGTDKDYGPSASQPDIDQDVFDVVADQHMNKLRSYQENWQQVERDTVSQSDSELWHQLRTEMITASKFGPTCRMLPTTSCANMVASIRYPKVVDTAATQFGLANENNARRDLASRLGKEIVPCGLFIDGEIPYLGASPDGLIDDDGIVEIICPFSARHVELETAISTKPNLRNIFDKKDKNAMNKNHVYFYQVQGQLHVTKREYCIFALWSSTDLKLVTVFRDDAFWESKMKQFLCIFYMECSLPEIVDSRRNRKMKIRDPSHILEAQKVAFRKKIAQQKSENVELRTGSTEIVVQSSTEGQVASIVPKVTASSGSKNDKDCAVADWIAIASDDELEVSEETLELLEIVRRDISVEEVEVNIWSPNSLLTDSSVDLFQNILQEHSRYRCNPACYTAYYKCIKPCDPRDRDVQIIGGNACRHWSCVYYDEMKVFIYDSLGRSEYEFLSKEEKRYISRRYPHVGVQDIFLQPVTVQPDPYSCGVYAAAFATTIALGDDPVGRTYSRDAKTMRAHLVLILRSRALIAFPCE